MSELQQNTCLHFLNFGYLVPEAWLQQSLCQLWFDQRLALPTVEGNPKFRLFALLEACAQGHRKIIKKGFWLLALLLQGVPWELSKVICLWESFKIQNMSWDWCFHFTEIGRFWDLVSKKFHNHSVIIHLWRLQRCKIGKTWKKTKNIND